MVSTAAFFVFLLSCPTQRLIMGVMAAHDPSGQDGSLGYYPAEDLRNAVSRVLDIISPAGDNGDPPPLPPPLSGIQPLERQTNKVQAQHSHQACHSAAGTSICRDETCVTSVAVAACVSGRVRHRKSWPEPSCSAFR